MFLSYAAMKRSAVHVGMRHWSDASRWAVEMVVLLGKCAQQHRILGRHNCRRRGQSGFPASFRYIWNTNASTSQSSRECTRHSDGRKPCSSARVGHFSSQNIHTVHFRRSSNAVPKALGKGCPQRELRSPLFPGGNTKSAGPNPKTRRILGSPRPVEQLSCEEYRNSIAERCPRRFPWTCFTLTW